MKKIISILLLALLIMTSLAGCSPGKKPEEQSRTEIKKESEAETALEKVKENSKVKKADTKDKNALYEFVKQDIKDLSKENFNLWEVNYLDITGDGNDEAVLAGVHGVEWPQKMQIISGDSGELKRIPSDIPLYKYENKSELRDGFFVVAGRKGGTGTEATVMNLYIYDGSKIINALRDIELFYRINDASFKGVHMERVGEIDGKLTDFILTVTEHDKVTGKIIMKEKERYIYNAKTVSFDVKLIEAQVNNDKNPASDSNMESKTINASSLKAGDVIDGHTVDKVIYTEGQEFGIGLNGKYTVTGEILYDKEFWGEIILTIDKQSALSTIIKFKFDDDLVCIPPSGTFIMFDNNLKLLESKIGSSIIAEIKNGKKLKVRAVIEGYAYYAKNQTSPMWSCNVVDIVNLESGKGVQS